MRMLCSSEEYKCVCDAMLSYDVLYLANYRGVYDSSDTPEATLFLKRDFTLSDEASLSKFEADVLKLIEEEDVSPTSPTFPSHY